MERFTLPENLADLSSEELSALENQVNERLAALREVSRPTSEDAAELQAIREFRTTVREQREVQSEFSAALADPDLAEATEEPEVAQESQPEIQDASEASEEPVVASDTGEGSQRLHRPPVPSLSVPEAGADRPQLTIVAAADIPQIPMGSQLSFEQLSVAVNNKVRVLGRSTARHPVATIEKHFQPGYDLRGLNDFQIMERLETLASPRAYEQALTASGGWCAPSEIIYDLFETICPRPSVFTLPTFRISRGGVRWPIWEPLDFERTFDWIWTEADDIAATGTKPCIEVDCPEFTECRADAHGVCVQIGNFIDRAYPEQVAWFLRRVFWFHARAESLFKINAVLAETDAVTVAGEFATASAVVNALLLQVQAYRDRNGLCCGELVEAWAPCWLREMIRADIARQEFGGVGNATLVSDAHINTLFRGAGVNVTWINFWQAFENTAGDNLVWPTSVEVLFYTPGAYVQFDMGTLDLGVTRDSVLNATNDFNIFTEDFYCIGRRGPEGVHLTIDGLCADGAVGARQLASCSPTGV